MSKKLTKEDPINEDAKEDTLSQKALKKTLSLRTLKRDPITEETGQNLITEDPKQRFCRKNYGFLVMTYHRVGDGDKLLLPFKRLWAAEF